jgi:hypothetical protein
MARIKQKSAIATSQESASQFDWDAMQKQLTEQDLEVLCLQKIATSLATLMAFEGKSRSEMAALLNVSKANITRLLNKTNIEAKSIYAFANALGYEFEVVFKKPEWASCGQPWNRAAVTFTQVHANQVGDLYNNQLIEKTVYVQANSSAKLNSAMTKSISARHQFSKKSELYQILKVA